MQTYEDVHFGSLRPIWTKEDELWLKEFSQITVYKDFCIYIMKPETRDILDGVAIAYCNLFLRPVYIATNPETPPIRV